jgi:hypothetical protein
MIGIFHNYARNRRQAAQARKQFVVVRVKKDGQPSKVQPMDMQFNATVTRAQAKARQAVLEQLNPGKTFTILALS